MSTATARPRPAFIVFPHAACMAYPPCVARVVLAIEPDGTVPVLYADETEVVMVPAAEALPYVAKCRAHRMPRRGKPVRGSYGAADCDDACELATGADCRCKCGGINHGVRS
jgi:hypothetical protein